MARRESFDKVALRLIQGTPFTSGEFYRVIPSTGIGEYVRVKDRTVVEFKREPHDDAPPASPRYKDKLRRSENEMELRGVVALDGTLIEYYGSEKGWQKFKLEWNQS